MANFSRDWLALTLGIFYTLVSAEIGLAISALRCRRIPVDDEVMIVAVSVLLIDAVRRDFLEMFD